MKNLLSLILLIGLVAVACNKDDNTEDAKLLNYDGPNDSAPSLPASDQYTVAAKFTPDMTEVYKDSTLTAVQFYLQDTPPNCFVKVFGPGENDEPGTELYSANVTAKVERDSWNTHTLSTPITITGEELWIALQFQHTESMTSIGCDRGPANENGDRIRDVNTNGAAWTRYLTGTGNVVSINWNIRGKIGN